MAEAPGKLQSGGNRKVLEEESYFTVTFADVQHGWVTGLAGEIVTTNDGGHTWRPYGGASRPSLFAAAEHGPAYGSAENAEVCWSARGMTIGAKSGFHSTI